ncbi:hypothetical protein [Streptosporangium saharense]|uniref:Putative anti-sigma-YlaC factor YlaD n=1 Tax=Streptosporangium saharense TaxID=1706840 RepID=A0A7W7QTH1_9ACTN|nr:hypothetical protein [Streptosporangium saharense]MBB4918896.1 putative anti-sigma-YlaC factor YlaD [Streptosporangium saharense]
MNDFPAPRRRSRAARALLWALLAVTATVNVVSNTVNGGEGSTVGLTAGMVTVACAVALTARHFRTARA